MKKTSLGLAALLLSALLLPTLASASSHSEAPGTSRDRMIDDTDLYAFVSPDAPNSVTLIGNWVPLLEPNAGPNFYAFDDDASYYLRVDNVGDAGDHIEFQLKFKTHVRNGNTFLYNVGPVNHITDATLNVYQTYTLTRFDNGVPTVLGADLPVAPANVGPTSMPNYDALAAECVRTLGDGTKVFVGPRDDPFFVDLGAIFDLLTIRALPGDRGRGRDGVAGYNVMTVAMQIPMTRLTKDGQTPNSNNSIIAIYDASERPASRTLNADGTHSVSGADIQVSRLGMPLVNEVVLPIGVKDRFNASSPTDDGQFLSYVTNSEVAGLFTALYGISVPPAPRNDLVAVFLTGVPGLNQPTGVVACEKLRLNMAIHAAPVPNRMGVLAGDIAGFPNGRRLTDDVVDIAERVVAGVLVPGFNIEPNNRLGDGVDYNDRPFLPSFPYVAPPFSGFDSPHSKQARPNPSGDRPTSGDSDVKRGLGEEGDAALAPKSLENEAGQSEVKAEQLGLQFGGKNPASAHDLRYSIAEKGHVSLAIFDLAGRQLRTLVDQEAAAGTFSARWDGRNDDGSMSAKGVYFARFVAGTNAADTKKIVLE
ncbi:MAG: DUF4331 family protein [Candidatus Eisenbacteria bacterium]